MYSQNIKIIGEYTDEIEIVLGVTEKKYRKLTKLTKKFVLIVKWRKIITN